MRQAFVFLILFVTNISFSQINVNELPQNLIIDAEGIILNQKETINILSKDEINAIYELEYVVLKDCNPKINKIFVPYDKFKKIKNIEVQITDKNGKILKKVKKGNFEKVGRVDYISDDRALIYEVYSPITPLFVKLKYTFNQKQTFSLPIFRPYLEESFSVLNSELIINNFDTLNSVKIRENHWGEPIIEKSDKRIKYSYQISNISTSDIKTKNLENYQYSIRPFLTSFQMDGQTGDMSSWSSFGQWFSKLNEGKDILDTNAKEEILSLINTTDDNNIKIQKLYDYLQEKSRYVSIQLGIGGYQPFDAQYVHDNRFGDCKALSNYMKTILSVAGIDSYYLLIKAGDNKFPLNNDFAENVFNHAILAVPNGMDTLFLECTASDNAVGYQGSFTGNRQALLIDGANSRLVKTKKYGFEENLISNKFEIKINNEGESMINQTQNLKGIGIEHNNWLHYKSIPKKDFLESLTKDRFNGITDIKIVKISNFRDFTYPSKEIQYEYKSSRSIYKSASRIFIDLDIENFPSEFDRTNLKEDDYFTIDPGYIIQDEFEIAIPEDCRLEKMPDHLDYKNDLGSVKILGSTYDKTIYINRKYILKEGIYNHLSRKDFDNYFKQANTIKKEKISLICD
jgi:hypothetical protein